MSDNSINKSRLIFFLTEKEIQNQVKIIAVNINADY